MIICPSNWVSFIMELSLRGKISETISINKFVFLQMLFYHFLCFSSSAPRPSFSPTAWPLFPPSLGSASLTSTMAPGVKEATTMATITIMVVTRASPWWGSAPWCSPVVSTQLTSHHTRILGTRVHCPSSPSSPAMTLQEVTPVQALSVSIRST